MTEGSKKKKEQRQWIRVFKKEGKTKTRKEITPKQRFNIEGKNKEGNKSGKENKEVIWWLYLTLNVKSEFVFLVHYICLVVLQSSWKWKYKSESTSKLYFTGLE